jgi:hypothetical protein
MTPRERWREERREVDRLRAVEVGGGPLRYAIIDGINVRDGRAHDRPPRWNGAPSQELLAQRIGSSDTSPVL